jgi:gamma-glutamyltranspeptidase/glutathione hydrolase
MAATPNPLATRTAVEVLRDGGNAIDAAIAAAAVLSVVEPHQTGIGGDCFALLALKGRRPLIAYNGSGRAPAAAHPDFFREAGVSAIEESSPHAITVPGSIDAWARLSADHGNKDLGELLWPAIGYAEDGYPVHSRTAFDWARAAHLLKKDPTATRIFLPGGRAPVAGELHHQPLLARTLRRIASEGREAFYSGAVAEDIVRYLRSLGGLHTLDDFAEAKGEYVEPIETGYRGFTVCQMPPNNQGITALIMLNILAGFDLAEHAPLGAGRLHLEVEAGRRAYADRNDHVADLGQAEVPVERLLSAGHAADLRCGIDAGTAAHIVPERRLGMTDTVYLSVVDRDLNAVSFINSLYHDFGSALVAPDSGVFLQSRGASFRLDPDHPNCIAPRKRPLHTIMPGMLTDGERAVMPFGVMGGDYQPFGHVHFLTNLLDFGCDLQESLDLARVFHDGQVLKVEPGVPRDSVKRLTALGHSVVPAD